MPVICNNGEVGIGGFDSMHVKADNNLKALKMTSSNINSILATALAAQVSGKGVMILYDNSSGACNSQIISIGGYSSQCP